MRPLPADDIPVFLSTLEADPRQRRLALTVLALSLLVFTVAAPLAKIQLPAVWAFIPIYESMLIGNDIITAVLLFSQFHSFRSKALMALANGYLFTAFMTVAHALTFPGLFAPTGLLGAGPQSTAWLYMIWHGAFPLFVVGYVLLKGAGVTAPLSPGRTRLLVIGCVTAMLAATAGFTLLATAGSAWLPPIMQGNRYTPAMVFVVSLVWLASLAALAALWLRRPHSVLDLWLMVVQCAWLIDIALSAMLNGGRFDLGFYAGRVYGLAAASFVLLVLLVESGMLYARLVELTGTLRRLTSTDPLTGLANRRAFDQAIEQEWRRSQRGGLPLSVLMIDVDHFKQYNDTYGHVAGDDCLRDVAAALAGNARRAGDLIARYGGEEFVALLPQTDAGEARQVAQRMCEAVLARAIPHRVSSTGGHVTVSIGVSGTVAGWRSGERASNDAEAPIASLLKSADEALYQAKAAGRNRVCEIAGAAVF